MLELTGKMIIIIFFTLIASAVAQQKVENPDRNLAYDYELYENVLDSELCETQLREMRAFEFYDASFRIPQSILTGGTFSLGNYHQCLGIKQPLENSTVEGKYCLIETESLNLPILSGNSWPGNVSWITTLHDTSPDYNYEAYKTMEESIALATGDLRVSEGIASAVKVRLALCIPRPCRVSDVLAPITESSLVEFNYTELQCRLPDDKPYSGADNAAVVVFSVIGLLTLLSSAYELYHIFIKKETSKPSELLSSFSVYCNTDRLMTISSKAGALDCLDGIRTFSILWVITGHTFLVHVGLLGTYVMNPIDINNWSERLDSLWLKGANVSVDSFFALSGLLLVYTAANKMKQKQLLSNLHLFYLNRLLRMFPLLAAAVLIQASVLNHVSDGVRWDVVALETQKCRDYWWAALLHVQNIVNPRTICLSHAWYLSLDMQLHILSPIILFWVLGSRRSAWSSLTAGLLGTLTATIVYCFIKEFSGLHDENYMVYFYHNTMTRSPVFLIGMFTGYLLHVSRGRQVKMPAWFVAFGYALALTMSTYSLYQRNAPWESQMWITLNAALVRSGWAIALCWLIYACVNGYAGPVNWFLSLKMWKFTARISYAMYIFHYPMMFVINGANVLPIYFSFESIFLLVASDITYTVIVSIAVCVLIDAPFSTLQRMLMAALAPTPPPKPAKAEVPPRSPMEIKDAGHKPDEKPQ